MSSIERIARSITADEGNILGDYFKFYNDGRWTVEIGRTILSTLASMAGGIAEYGKNLPTLEDNVGYMKDVKLDEMGTAPFAAEIGKSVTAIKKAHGEWEKASDDAKASKYDAYAKAVSKARVATGSFLQSCSNVFASRYNSEFVDVSNLLGVMRDANYYILQNPVQNARQNGNASHIDGVGQSPTDV